MMPSVEFVFWMLAILALICGFLAIGMTFYLGRNKLKEIDRLVYNHEILYDSIFYLILRLPTYGAAFSCRWCAKRSHLLHIRDRFDKKFQRPFIITHYLFMFAGIVMIVLIVWDKMFLNITQ